MIWILPIEPLEERYSKQWLKWFKEELDYLEIKEHKDYEIIYGRPLSNTIRQGSFLDVISTNFYKTNQLQKVCNFFEEKRVRDGDIFFIHDGWFPGIEILAYIRDALEIDFKIYSILHAGTYDPHDFLTQKGMRKWGQYLERSWIELFNGVFVATQYHKNLLLNGFFPSLTKPDGTLSSITNKIYVTGLPIYPDFVKPNTYKENIVVFPHRLDSEKQPEVFDEVAERFRKEQAFSGKPAWNFIKTKDFCKSKNEYYNLLNMSKISVSTALQETFGIAMIESVLCGCIPVVPDRLSYEELYSSQFKYRDNVFLYSRLKGIMDYYESYKNSQNIIWQRKRLLSIGEKAISKMFNIMRDVK